ncbi:MAG TPA: sodium/solute symporter, partial [Candidatus Hydrogenedentes bacterium]|nr:sodium/solute symporter [Candidatus Hydrogenedentota bacterium]
PHYLHMQLGTMPQFVRRRFGNGPAEFVSWYALLSTVILWLGGTSYAGGKLLSQIMDWPLWTSVVALTALATFLTVVGGLAVVIVTDTFQSILMLAGAGLLTLFGLRAAGGLGAVIENVEPDRWTLFRPASDPDYPWHAIVLGYPVLGIWFWCTDQTIVQRVLGARDLRQGQQGAQFAAFLKILTPFFFMLPGFVCFVLYPDLDDPDKAFTTMISRHLPFGMLGLMIAVLIAALISTVDSGLNSFSTVFTLDIYQRKWRPMATPRELKVTGRVVTVAIAVCSVFIALSMETVGKNLFDLMQSIIAYFAPPIAAVFLIGILWRRATAKAALATLLGGSTLCLGIGLMDFMNLPGEGFWPHFLLTSFLLFAWLCLVMIGVSLLTQNAPEEETLPSFRETYARQGRSPAQVWIGWAILAAIMAAIYLVFN